MSAPSQIDALSTKHPSWKPLLQECKSSLTPVMAHPTPKPVCAVRVAMEDDGTLNFTSSQMSYDLGGPERKLDLCGCLRVAVMTTIRLHFVPLYRK